MPVYTTACPRNCYSTCSMKVFVKDGRLRMIESHPQNRATPEGVCLKGLSYVERVYSRDRLLYPLRKSSRGDFERVSWHEALQIISEKAVYFRDKYGPQSILYYSASGTKGLLNACGLNFWRLFGGCTTTYGDLCWPAGLEATRLMLGENKHNAPWDIENARLIILWGKNAAETNIHQMYYIDRALEKGGRLVVIDPRRTQSSERAELLIQPRPGTDGMLAMCIAAELIRRDMVDRKFIEKHILGFEKYEEKLQKIDLKLTAQTCEIPETQILKLVEMIGTIRPVTINCGFGMQRYTNSGQTMRAIISLLAITANIGKPGAGWIFANLQSAIFDEIKDPVAFYPPVKPDGVIRVSVSTSRLGADILAQNAPPIKMLWVERGNPVTQNPETNTVLKAIRGLEFRVVVEQFMTDTAREADLILPAKTMFEQTDVIGAYWHPYIQIKQKVIDPPGEVKPESEIYWLLARETGIPVENLEGKIPVPGDSAVEQFLESKLNKFPGLTIEKLKDGPIAAPGQQEIAFSDHKFPTPSGKIEIWSKQARELWGQNELPSYIEPVESGRNEKRFPLYFMTPNTKNRIHSQFNNLQIIRQYSDRPLLYMHPVDAENRRLKSGDRARIFNERGEIKIEVKTDFGLKPGCVAVTNGWWISEGGTVNFLSAGRETDMGHGAAFHDNLVEVEKI